MEEGRKRITQTKGGEEGGEWGDRKEEWKEGGRKEGEDGWSKEGVRLEDGCKGQRG